MKIIKSIIPLLLLFAIAINSSAQERQASVLREKLAVLKDSLRLSNEAFGKLKKELSVYNHEMLAVMNEQSLSHKLKVEKVESIRKKRNASLAQMLGPQGYQYFLAFEQEWHRQKVATKKRKTP